MPAASAHMWARVGSAALSTLVSRVSCGRIDGTKEKFGGVARAQSST